VDRCWVIGGGPSGKKKIETDDDLIVVNKDIFRYPLAKYFVTMDNRFAIWELNGKNGATPKFPTKIFIANAACEHLRIKNGIVDQRWGISYDLSHYDWIIRSCAVGGIGTSWNDFRSGGNSGFCAFQLALLLGYKEIHLVGFDLGIVDGKTHHHDGYTKCKDDYKTAFSNYRNRFVDAVRYDLPKFKDVKVINHSPTSMLKDFLGYEPL